jgi:hypothetical protein
VFEGGHSPALGTLRAAVQDQVLVRQVITHHGGVVPLRPPAETQIEQHAHRSAVRDFRQQGLDAAWHWRSECALAPRRSQHLDLQAAAAHRHHHLREEHLGVGGKTGRAQQAGERGGAAVVRGLREKRRAGLVKLRAQRDRPPGRDPLGGRRCSRCAIRRDP